MTRFSLRTVLIGVTLLAACFAFVGNQASKYRSQPILLERAVTLAKDEGDARLYYDYDTDLGTLSYEGPMSLELAKAIVAAKRIRDLSTKGNLDATVRSELQRAFEPTTANVEMEEGRYKSTDGQEYEHFRAEFAHQLNEPGRHRDGTQDWRRKHVGIFWAPFP